MSERFDPPVFVNVRDRWLDLRALVEWLEKAGHTRIVLLDNETGYEPCLDYLATCPHEVVRLRRNLGSRALWRSGLAPTRTPFVYSDPDVVPVEDCPLDALGYLNELLERYPEAPKAALGLHLDDVPADLKCLQWERSLVDPWRELEPGVFLSAVDTTFALYRPGVPFSYDGLRTGWPYVARHTYWYEASTDGERDERAYYFAHCKGGIEGSSAKDGLQ